MSERRAARPAPPLLGPRAHSLALGLWWLFLAVVVPTGVWTLLGAAGCR